MPIGVHETFERGGRELIDLLEYCVLSMNFDALFVFSAREYRLLPSVPAALALYDVFCTPGAPARISTASLLPPRDLRLPPTIEPQRQLLERARRHVQESGGPPPVLPAPATHLFDYLTDELLKDPKGPIACLPDEYDPRLEPAANLPDGKMNAGQRAFVENLWRPRLRPWLVTAGFRRLANVA